MFWLKDFLLPDHQNDHRASLLKPQVLSFITLIFVGYQVALNFFTLSGVKVLGYAANISPERIIELTNQRRAAQGLGPVKENALLSEAARRKAGDMFAFNYWAHVSPSGRDPWTFFKEVGYHYVFAGENLARDFKDPESVVQAWMNSPSHRDNLLNNKYQEIGVAVVDGSLQGMETTLVVQLFGSQSRQVANKPQVTPQPTVALKPAAAEKPAVAEKPVTVPTLAFNRNNESIKGYEENNNENTNKNLVINPFSLTKIISILLAGLIFGAFLFDFLLVSEKKTPRLSGHSFAQMLFLGFVIILVLIARQGIII